MRYLTLLLVLCAVQTALAQDQPNLAALRASCADDAQRLCPGVQPGGGRILACLKEHKDSLSDRCKKAAGLSGTSSGGSGTGASNSPASEPSDSRGAATGSPAAKTSNTAPAKSKTTGGSSSGKFLRLKQAQVIAKVDDPAFGGKAEVPALDLLIPSGWTFKSNVAGNTQEGCYSDFFATSWEAASPDNSMAFQGAPNDSWQYTDDPAELKKLNNPMRRALGIGGKPCPVKNPVKAEEYFRQTILSVFPSGSSVVSIDPFPELNQIARKQLGLQANDSGKSGSTRTEAIRARVKFQKDSQDSEAWVTVVIVTRVFPQGRGAFYDCHAIDIMSLRAPQGQLDANDKLFRVMISSIRTEQKWQTYSGGKIARLYQVEAQKEAAMDSMVAKFQQQVAEAINGVVANSVRGANQAAFGQDQLIRGVQTFRDPTTGNTMELSNLYDHAWLNNSNEYIMSDDPNFNPNGQLNGSWNELQVVRPQP